MGPRAGVAMFDQRGVDAAQGPSLHPAPADDWEDPAAEEVQRAWEAVPAALFGAEEARGRAFEVFARLGLVGALAGARRAGQSVDAFAALALSRPEVRAVNGHRAIVHAWIAPLRRPAQGVPPPRQSGARLATLAEDPPDEVDRRPEPEGASRQVSFGCVRAQQDAIEAAMRQKNLGRARHMIEELCAYQGRGKPIYLAKSLCNLATVAQRHGLHQLQDELTDRAVRVCPDDPWSWSQRGTALRRLGQLPEALQAFDRALLFGADAAARNGRADVLRAMGRVDEALRVYEETAHDHPENVYARHGRGEALKAMGRLDDALAAYDEMLREDEGDVFAKSGRACVFKIQGRLEEALRAYQSAAQDHPDNVALKTGCAEVLKSLGRLPEALEAYDAAARAHPGSVVVKSGRAELLKEMGRLDEALAAYDAILRDHPIERVVANARAEVLRALGRYEEALSAYDAILRTHADCGVAKSGRAMVLKSLRRYDEALDAFDGALRERPANLVVRASRAEVFLVQGRFDEARAAYEAILHDHPGNDTARHGRARVLKAEGRFDEALAAYDAILAEQPATRWAQRARADVLRAAGRLDEALGAYGIVLHDHPADLVAVTGRACALALHGRSREALRALPRGAPATEGQWAAYLARGLVLLRAGRAEDATAVLDEGRRKDLLVFRRDAHRVALAIALLARRRPIEALEVLAEVREHRYQVRVDMLRVHAFGAQGRFEEARASYHLFPPAAAGDLVRELYRRFVERAPAEHDDAWLIRREVEAALRTA